MPKKINPPSALIRRMRRIATSALPPPVRGAGPPEDTPEPPENLNESKVFFSHRSFLNYDKTIHKKEK